MTTLEQLVASGDIALVASAILLVEFLVLKRIYKWSWKVSAFAVLPGVFLILALWSALAGYSWVWTALFLGLSLPSHLFDLWGRRP